MSTHDEHDLLTRALREHAGTVGGHPIGIDAVRGRARGIRRRRRAVAGAVAGAVLAVALPLGLDLGGGVRGSTPAPTDRSPAVVPTAPTPAPTPQPDGTFPLTVSGLPEGPAAGLPYIEVGPRALQTRDGAVALPEAYLQLTRFGDGWLALRQATDADGGVDVVELDTSFRDLRAAEAAARLLVDRERRLAAWVEEDGGAFLVTARPDTGEELSRVAVPAESEPVGFLGGDTVVVRALDLPSRRMGVLAVDAGTGTTTPVAGFLTVTAASPALGLVAGMVSYDDAAGGSCWAVADPLHGDRPLWETCDHALGAFSPDGQYVVGLAAYSDGPGSPTLAVLDARTGSPLIEFAPPQGARVVTGVAQAEWEDADTVLAVLTEDDLTRVVRAELDGRLEAASVVYPERNLSLSAWFAEQPR